MTALLIGLIILPSLFFSPLLLILALAVILLFCAHEFYLMHSKFHGKNGEMRDGKFLLPMTLGILLFTLSAIGSYYGAAWGIIWKIPIVLFAFLLTIVLALNLKKKKPSFLLALPYHLSLFFYPVLLLSSLGLLLFDGGAELQSEFLLLLFLCTWAGDIGAYLFGRAVGKRALVPEISPGKTREGATGGILLSVVTAGIVAHFLEFNIIEGLLLGIACGIWTILGDLTESKMKRAVGIKDSGVLLKGHGGFLDRFDGFLFNIPIAGLIYLLFSI